MMCTRYRVGGKKGGVGARVSVVGRNWGRTHEFVWWCRVKGAESVQVTSLVLAREGGGWKECEGDNTQRTAKGGGMLRVRSVGCLGETRVLRLHRAVGPPCPLGLLVPVFTPRQFHICVPCCAWQQRLHKPCLPQARHMGRGLLLLC